MPNRNLEDRKYNHDGSQLSYNALAMRLSRLENARESCNGGGDCGKYARLGGDAEYNRLSSLIGKEQSADYNVKKVAMDTGLENQFKREHTKDRDNANPTAIGGMVKMHKGSINDKIVSNKEVYSESVKRELVEIYYLMQYLS